MSKTGRPGVSLLEAVVALAIVGAVSVATVAAVGAHLRADRRAAARVTAAALAEHRLASLELLSADELRALPAAADGRFDGPFTRYRWQLSVRRADAREDVFDVAVRVAWDDGVHALHGRLHRPSREVGGP